MLIVCEQQLYVRTVCGLVQMMFACASVLLLQATQSLVNAIKFEADGEGDPEARRRLLDAAKALADATSKMVEAAKVRANRASSQWCLHVCVRAAFECLRLPCVSAFRLNCVCHPVPVGSGKEPK